jgi:hypothetical protein
VATKEVADTTMMFMSAAGHKNLAPSCARRKRLRFCVLGGILFPLVHLLLELTGLFLVDE